MGYGQTCKNKSGDLPKRKRATLSDGCEEARLVGDERCKPLSLVKRKALIALLRHTIDFIHNGELLQDVRPC